MQIRQLLLRPAAAEVRQMLHRIKMDNVERGRVIAAANGAGSNAHHHHARRAAHCQPQLAEAGDDDEHDVGMPRPAFVRPAVDFDK